MKHDVSRLMTNHRGKYLLVNALSRRVRALQSGYKPLVQRGSGNYISLAMDEFRQGKIDVSTDEGSRLAGGKKSPEEAAGQEAVAGNASESAEDEEAAVGGAEEES